MQRSAGNVCLRVLLTLLAGVAVASAQTYGYVSNEMGNNISVVNLATNAIKTTISLSGVGMTCLAMSPNGSYLYVTEQSKNCVAIIKTSNNTLSGTVNVGSGPVQVAFTPNGDWAYVANANSNNVSVINTSTKAVVDYHTSWQQAKRHCGQSGRHDNPGDQSDVIEHLGDQHQFQLSHLDVGRSIRAGRHRGVWQ